MKKRSLLGVVMLAGLLGAVLFSCSGQFEGGPVSRAYAIQTAEEKPIAAYLSPSFDAYDPTSPVYSTRAIAENDRLDLMYFQINLNSPLSVTDAIEFCAADLVPVTHLLYRDQHSSHIGSVAAYRSYRSTVDEINAIIDESVETCAESMRNAIQRAAESGDDSALASATHELNLLDAIEPEITGFQAVLDESTYLRLVDDERVESVDYIEIEEPADTEVLPPARYVTAKAWEPDYHYLNVYASGTNRIFYWEGRWTTAARLTSLAEGDRPAWEPDIKIRYSTFLGFPTKGWAEPNPRSNGHAWASNMPNGYIDSQTSDMAERAFTVGSTAPETFVQNTLYYYQITSPEWNSTLSKHRELAYELQKWSKHKANCESDAWCVGTIIGGGKEEAPVFSMGDNIAPYSASY